MKIKLLLLIGILLPLSAASSSHQLIQAVEDKIQYFINEQDDYPSGVIAIASSNSVLMLKGFGLSDIDNNIEFDPQKSLVNTASISKMITATAILQLIENQEIDLDTFIDKYLGEIQLRNPYKKKVTIRDLLMHTSGMSDQSISLSSASKEQIPTIKNYLKSHLPPVVWEPGKYWNYSNFAYVLLARVIENVSGMTYQDYVQQHIFNPLEMSSSHIGADYDNPLQMKRYKWRWYNDDSGIYLDDKGSSYSNLIGASGFITTGQDMTHFIQAYLRNGIWNQRKILNPETVQSAWATQFSYDEKIPHKQGLGWAIKELNDVKQVYHHGDGSGIETALMFLPEKDIAVFMSFNNHAEDVKYKIIDLITNYYYPNYSNTSLNFIENKDTKQFEGTYRYMNLSQHTFEKIVYLFGIRTVAVKSEQSAVVIDEIVYQAIDEDVFRRVDKFNYAKFLRDDGDHISHLTFGYSTYIKLYWWENPILHQLLFVAGVLLFVGLFIYKIVSLLLKKRALKNGLMFLVWNGMLIPLAFISMVIAKDGLSIDAGVSSFFWLVFSLPVIALIIYPLSFYKFYQTMKNSSTRISKYLCLLIFVLLSIQLLLAYYYNLIGYHFG